MKLFSTRNHSYIKLVIIWACIGSLSYIFFYFYGSKHIFRDVSNYFSPYVPDPYTLSVRDTIHGLKSLRLPMDSAVARPLIRLKGEYRLAPRYNLSFCLIEKAMCTILQNIFCYLFDSEGFTANKHRIAGTGSDFWGKNRWCWNKNEVYGTRKMHLIAPHITSNIFMIRNPIERFISAFVNNDKSRCFNCSGDILCVVEAFHSEIMQLNRRHWDITIPSAKVIPQSYVSRHMAPSNWQCDLYDEVDNAVFIKYGETAEELNQTFTELARVLEANDVEKYKIDFILNSVNGNLTRHATKKLGLRDKYYEQIRASPKHAKLLNEMIRSLIAIISLGFMALLNFYLYSYNSLLRGSLTTGQNLTLTKEKVLIYGATTFFGKPLWSKDIISETCSQEIQEYCHFTTNPNRSKEADAWLYHNRDFLPQMMESRGDAVHVMLCHESPTYETILYTANTINWTMTYKRGSDIVIPYGIFAKNDSIEDLDFIWNMKSPNVTASWMASHCNTANRREQLILKARNSGLQLDVYGKCHNGSQIPECPKDSKDWETCAGAVLQKYFFYFSFENSNCVDYVTEKLYNSWAFYFTVPIVIKREIYTKIGFPPKSFIALDDFASIQDLVYFLNYLKTNKREYLRYHEWRKEYEVKRIRMESGLCTLCQRLKYPTLQTKSYLDLKSWFSQEADCDNSYADKYL